MPNTNAATLRSISSLKTRSKIVEPVSECFKNSDREKTIKHKILYDHLRSYSQPNFTASENKVLTKRQD